MKEVTAGGIRSGEPEALAGLCKRRGGAVLVYSEHVAAPGQAGHAAADAFGRFRAQIVAADDPSLDAEALLLSATRYAAAARGAFAGTGADEHAECPSATLLVGWIEDTLSTPEREYFEQHVVGCSACVEAVARFEAAERAYEHPPEAPLPASIARLIVGALVQAAPVTALNGDLTAVREAAEKGVVADAPPPNRAATYPAAATAIASDRANGAPQPAETLDGSSPPSPRRTPAITAPSALASGVSRVLSQGKGTGSAMAERAHVLAERGRHAVRRGPRFDARRPGFGQGMDRTRVRAIAVAGVLALVVAVVVLLPGGSSTPSDETASSAAGGSPAADGGGATPAEPAVATPTKAERDAAKAEREAEARRSAAAREEREARARRAASRRRAAAADRRRRAAAAERRRRAAASPSAQSPAPAQAQEPERETTPPPPPPPPAKPARPKPSPTPSDELPGGDFTVGGET